MSCPINRIVLDKAHPGGIAIKPIAGLPGEGRYEQRPIGWPSPYETAKLPEFTSKSLDLWAYENSVTLDFSRPGKPTDNPFIDWAASAVIQWEFSR